MTLAAGSKDIAIDIVRLPVQGGLSKSDLGGGWGSYDMHQFACFAYLQGLFQFLLYS